MSPCEDLLGSHCIDLNYIEYNIPKWKNSYIHIVNKNMHGLLFKIDFFFHAQASYLSSCTRVSTRLCGILHGGMEHFT